jgi:hypothetical protein
MGGALSERPAHRLKHPASAGRRLLLFVLAGAEGVLELLLLLAG